MSDEKRAVCPVCGAENQAAAKFCNECGIKLEFARSISTGDSEGKDAKDSDLDTLLEDLVLSSDDIIIDEEDLFDFESDQEEEDKLLESLLALEGEIGAFPETKKQPSVQKTYTRPAATPKNQPAKVPASKATQPKTTPTQTITPPTPTTTPPPSRPRQQQTAAGYSSEHASSAATPSKTPTTATATPPKAQAPKTPPVKTATATRTPTSKHRPSGKAQKNALRGRYLDITVIATLSVMIVIFIAGQLHTTNSSSAALGAFILVAVAGTATCIFLFFSRQKAVETGDKFMLSRKYAEAVATYDKAIGVLEDSEDAWTRKGDSFRHNEQYKEAVECYDKAINIDPLWKDAWLGKGSALYKMGEKQKALICFKNSVKIDRSFADGWNNMGQTYFSLGHVSDALRCFDQAISMDSQRPEFWANKGLGLIRVGKQRDAESCLAKGKMLTDMATR